MFKQSRIFVRGSVIGVGFRAWVKYQSKFVNVKGWVRNVEDEVEVLLQGEEQDIKNMTSRIKKGPPVSNVKNVAVTWEDPDEIYKSFEIT